MTVGIDLAEAQASLQLQGLCPCGCGRPVDRLAGSIYAEPTRCRKRAYRQRQQAGLVRSTEQRLRESAERRARHLDAEARKLSAKAARLEREAESLRARAQEEWATALAQVRLFDRPAGQEASRCS